MSLGAPQKAVDAMPEGFEPVAPVTPQTAPASPAAAQPAMPEGFEPVPASELRPITPAPPSFLDRLGQGSRLMERAQSVWQATKEGFGKEPISTDTGMPNGLANLVKRPVEAFDLLTRTINAGIHGAADVAAQGVQVSGGSEGWQERAREDVENFGTWIMSEYGMRKIAGEPLYSNGDFKRQAFSPLVDAGNGDLARVVQTPQGPQTQVVGKFPPTREDFANAANVIRDAQPEKIQAAAMRSKEGGVFTGPTHGDAGVELENAGHSWDTEAPDAGSGFVTNTGRFVSRDEAKPIAERAAQLKYPELVSSESVLHARDLEIQTKLHQMWEEQGIHPVEAAEDAKSDAFVAHDLSSAAAHPTELPPLAPEQPPSIPGKIMSDLRAARDKAFDVGRWIEKALTPISSSPDYAVRYVEDYLSHTRRVAWEAANSDKRIVDNFTKEQRQAVWRAMDEESVMAQSGERSEHMGLATLAPDELALAKELSAQSIATRMQMLDRGMVTDDGLPHYVPRVFNGLQKGEPLSLGPAGRIREKTGSMIHRKYLTAEESEAAAKARFGDQAELVRDVRVLPMVLAKQQRAIAAHDFIESVKKFGQDIGDTQIIEGDLPAAEAGKYFTIPDSDLYKWRFIPKSEEGGSFDKLVKQPLHIKAEWEGAIQAILDTKFGKFDSFIANVKNRPLTLIMNSPFIHDSVVYSKALPANPGNLLTFRFLRQGGQLAQDQEFMRDMLNGGLVPWGKRPGLYQDVSSIAEGPTLEPGRSVTADILAYVPDLFSKDAGNAVKSAVDRAGEFWHDKLLGEFVQRMQVSLAYDFRETMRKKFPEMPDDVLNVLAAHEGNRFAGSLPPEAMSAFSRGFTNALFFSRQFTFGNLGILKDAVKGPPEYVMARVREMMGPAGADEAAALKSEMRRHAFSVVMLDLAMYYGMNAMLQSAVNLASGTPMSDEVAGYWWRMKQATQRVIDQPLTPSSYLAFLPSMSPTFYHEPGKEGKILLGLRDDGTAIYARSVLGRMGEDYTGLAINPGAWLFTKMAPLPRAAIELFQNRDGFDRPIFDPKALRSGDLHAAWAIASHLIEAELPMQQVKGGYNLATGQGDYKDAINTFGPYLPPPMTVTGSQGYPGGPVAGVVTEHKRNERVAQDVAMSEIKRMVQKDNDLYGARQKMQELGVSRGLQNVLIRSFQHPGIYKNNPRAIAEFYKNGSPMEKEVLDYMLNNGGR